MSSSNRTAGHPVETPRRPWMVYALVGVSGIVVLALLTIVGLRLYFNDAYIQSKVTELMEQTLGRPCSIGDLDASLLAGTVTLKDVRVLPGKQGGDSNAAPLSLSRAEVRVSLWTLVTSSMKECKGVYVELDGLKLEVIRSRQDSRYVTDWDDVMAKFMSGPPGTWPKATGLKALDYRLHLKNSHLQLQDEEFGASSIESLTLDVSQAGLGQPAAFQLAGALRTPRNASPGKILLEGSTVWIDEQGLVGPTTIRETKSGISLQDADLGQLAQYAGLQGLAKDGEMRWSLGQKFSGELKVEAPKLDDLRLVFTLETDELMAVRREGGDAKRQPGLLPAKVNASLSGAWRNGTLEAGPLNVAMDIAASTSQLKATGTPRWLTFRMSSKKASAGDEPFSLALQADLTGLCSSAMGAALGLKDQYGGQLDARASVSRTADGLHTKGNLKTEEFFVAVGGTKQPSGLQLDYDLAATRNAKGEIDQVSGTLAAKARPFQITTLQPLMLKSLSTPRHVEGTAKLRMEINGRELWKEFGPLLKIVNLGDPLEEAISGDLVLSSEAGRLKGSFAGTLQQQSPEPRPILLKVDAQSELAARERMDGTPFARFEVQLGAQDKSFNVQMNGQLNRTKTMETWELGEFKALGSLAAIGNLNRRLGKYVSFFLGPEYDVKGYFTQTAHSKLVRHLAPDGSIATQNVSFITDLTLKQLDLRGPALVKAGIPLRWEEKDDVTLHLELVQNSRGSAAPGTPSAVGTSTRDTVAIPKVVLKSGSLNLEGSLSETAISALAYAADATTVEDRFKRWLAAMPSAKLDAWVNQASVKRLQELGILPNEPLLAGSLRVKASHDAATHRVDVEKLDLQHEHWTVVLGLQGLNVETLRTALSQSRLAGWQKVVPSATVQVSLKPAGVECVQTLLREARAKGAAQPPPLAVWENPAWSGQLDLSLAYDAPKGALSVNGLTFTGAAAKANVTAPSVSLSTILSFFDQGKTDLAAVSALLTDCSLDAAAGPRLFDVLKQHDLLPKDLDLAGLLTLRARYQREKDRLLIDQLDFKRTDGSACLISSFALTKPSGEPEEVARLSALLASLDLKKPLHAIVATIASHLEMGVHVHSLEVSTRELLTFLRAQGLAQTFIADVRAGIYRIAERIQLSALSARKGAKPGSYELFTRIDLAADWHPRSGATPLPQREPAASIDGAMRLSPAVVVLDPLRTDVEATVLLDDLHVNLACAAPYFVYEKPLATPCRFRFSLGLPERGGLHVPSAALTGGPLALSMTDLQQSATGAWTCELLELTNGPLPGKLTGFLYDEKNDRLRVAFDAQRVDMASAVKYASLPKTFTASGSLEKIHGSYDGRTSVLPDRMGEEDKMLFQCILRDVVLSGRPMGKSADLSINGTLNASPYELSSPQLTVGLNFGITGQPAVAQGITTILEKACAREPRMALPTALLADGLPLLVRGRVVADTPIHVEALLDTIATLSESVNAVGPVTSGPTDLNGIRRLRLELGLQAPSLTLAGQTFTNLQAQQLIFEGLMLSIPLANAEIGGGQMILRDALYNVGATPIGHHQRLTVSDVDLHVLTFDPSKPPAKGSYQVFGKLSATGSLSGSGFLQPERSSWQGELKTTIRELVLEKRGVEDQKAGPGGGFFGDIRKLGMRALGDIFDGLVLPGTGKVMRLYQDDFGLFLSRMEFKNTDIAMTIRNGLVDMAQGTLEGKGKNDGLIIGFLGKIDLPSQSFKPTPFHVWFLGFPPSTQKLMHLDELSETEREGIMQDFRRGNPSLWLSGTVTSPSPNAAEFAISFQEVLKKIDRLIAARKQAQPGATPAPGTAPSTGTETDAGTKAEKPQELPLPFTIPDWLKKK